MALDGAAQRLDAQSVLDSSRRRHGLRERSQHAWSGQPALFAEAVMFREAAGPGGQLIGHRRRRKAYAVWRAGTDLGRGERSNEHILGTRDGALLSRFVKRLPATQGADTQLLSEMCETPWSPRE